MRFAPLAAALALLTITPVFADSAGDVMLMRKAFASLKSVHADVVSSNGVTIALDFFGTDKMHEILPEGVQVINIGQNIWESVSGPWHKLPHRGQLQGTVRYVRTLGLDTNPESAYTITDAGQTNLGGMQTERYHLVEKATGRGVDVWVGINHLPVKVLGPAYVGGATLTVTYSQYNSVANIAPPI